MLRELIDAGALEDFVGGLARSSGLRVTVFDAGGRLIAASPPNSEFARLTGRPLDTLPAPLEMTPLRADEPPAGVAFVADHGGWQVVAPVHVADRPVGFVGVGDFRDPADRRPPPPPGLLEAAGDNDAWQRAWQSLPPLERSGEAAAVRTARWTSRMLARWCRDEALLTSAAEQLGLLGSIGEMLVGERDLQSVLDRIVAETARVMKCRYCSLRLYDPDSEQLFIAAGHNLPAEYLQVGRVLRADNPIDDAALSGRSVYIEDARSDPRMRFPDIARRVGFVSGLAVGLLYRGQPVGTLRVYADQRRRFRGNERHLLRAVAAQAAIAIVNARLLQERLRSLETERQVALAGGVQNRMVRLPPPVHPQIQTALIYEPSSHVGGDFGDVFTLADGRLAAAVGDVSGHGVPAALLMASVRGALRASAETCSDLGELLTRLNRQVFRETSSSEFVSLLLIALDASAGRMAYSNAGHDPALVLRGGRVLRTDQAGTVLGLGADERYRQAHLPLEPGDFILLYTDGVVEAMNFEGEPFGRDRLHASLQTYGRLPPDQALGNIRWDVRRFVGLAEQSDDLTLVGLRLTAGE